MARVGRGAAHRGNYTILSSSSSSCEAPADDEAGLTAVNHHSPTDWPTGWLAGWLDAVCQITEAQISTKKYCES